MGFGDFMSGLQGGREHMQKSRRARQVDEMLDIELRKEKDIERESMDQNEAEGLDPNYDSLGDTYGGRLAGWVGGKLGMKRSPYYTPQRTPEGTVDVQDIGTEQAAEAAESVPDAAPGTIGTGVFAEEDPRLRRMPMAADGGRMRRALHRFDAGGGAAAALTPEQIERARMHEEALERAERARRANSGKVEGATETVKRPIKGAQANPYGNVSTQGVGRVGGPSRTHLARRALDRAGSSTAGKLGVAGALGMTAYDVYNTPTEDYYERFGLDPSDPSLPKDLAVRTGGAATDLASTLTLGATDSLYADKVRKRKEAEEQGTKPAPKPAETPAGAVGGAATEAREADPESFLPDLDKIDFSNKKPGDVTNMTVTDWEKFRRNALRSQLVRRVPYGEAVNIADQQTVQLQQRGFANFANQAIRLMAANNTDGAMAALKAAYQMAPTGDDINLGTYNGQIYGVTIDEATGKPTGQPMLITPSSVSALLKEAAVPGAWEEHARDRRDFAYKERNYEEVLRPTAQAGIDRSGAIADYNLARATGQGGLSEAQKRYNMTQFEKRLDMIALEDPALADQYRSEMQRLQTKYPQLEPGDIIRLVLADDTGGEEG